MGTKLLIATAIYIAIIICLAVYSRKGEQNSKNYLMGGSSIGGLIGMFTFAATLFSTFTLMGMPDFFRTHGAGAWIFLSFSNAMMFFGVISIGTLLRKSVKESKHEYYGMAGFMEAKYNSKLVGYLMFAGDWAIGMVIVMLVYSELGGLKAIIYSDVLQGILLFVVVWIIGAFCLRSFGGMEAMFDQLQIVFIRCSSGYIFTSFYTATYIHQDHDHEGQQVLI